jgi:hypothetical protein
MPKKVSNSNSIYPTCEKNRSKNTGTKREVLKDEIAIIQNGIENVSSTSFAISTCDSTLTRLNSTAFTFT